jgi:hypothetical protein
MNETYYYDKGSECRLARAYVPFQIMNQVFSPDEALRKGTLFPELYEPYKSRSDKDCGGVYYG